MGRHVKYLPCDECGSSDNRSLYQAEDGTYNSTCWGCDHFIPLCDAEGTTIERKSRKGDEMQDELTVDDVQELPQPGDRDRKIVKKMFELYGCRAAKVDSDDWNFQYFPFHKDGELVGYQQKNIAEKTFKSVGYGKQNIDLQGMELWPNGGGKVVVITEGFLDAMAAQQMLTDKVNSFMRRYPIVSLPNGANANSILKNDKTVQWLESFEKVILMLDQDTVGEKCARKIGNGLKAGICRIAQFSEKDACDMLKEGKEDEFKKAFWNAQPFSPAGIVTASDARELLSEENIVESLPYPDFATELNMSWYGKRKGEITLFAAGTGVGKSSFFKEDMYHIMRNTNEKVGVVSLEESTRDIMMSMQSLYLNKRVNLPDVELTVEETEDSLTWLEGLGERFVMLDHQGSSVEDDLLQKIRYLINIGCGYIYIDHITLATAGADNTNKAIDDFMDALLKLCKKKNAPWFGVVSHLRKTGGDSNSFEEGGVPTLDDLKGSGSIKQIAFDVIMFARNQNAKTAEVRNRTDIFVKKSRATGRTGPAGSYAFDPKTGRLKMVDKLDINDDDDDDTFE